MFCTDAMMLELMMTSKQRSQSDDYRHSKAKTAAENRIEDKKSEASL